MLHRRGRSLFLGLGLSLMLTTGVMAAGEDPVNRESDSGQEAQVPEIPVSPNPLEESADSEEAGETEEEVKTEEETVLEETLDPEKNLLASGFQTEGDKVFYYDEQGVKKIASLFEIDGRLYSTDGEGALQVGWTIVDGATYFFSGEDDGTGGSYGAALTGWQTIDGQTYYFQPAGPEKGKMATGFQTIGEKDFYFKMTGDPGVKGRLLTGWHIISGKTYYFKMTGDYGLKGSILKGWQDLSGSTYYFTPTGKRGVSGAMVTGFKKISSKTFYFEPAGAKKVKGRMALGFRVIKGKTYYFKKTGSRLAKGRMLTGRQTLTYKGKEEGFCFNSKGMMEKDSWQKHGGNWYYYQKNGLMAKDWTYVRMTEKQRKSLYHKYNTFKYYFRAKDEYGGPKGALLQDTSLKLGAKIPYKAEVNRGRCLVTLYTKDIDGEYRIPVKAFTCSVGKASTPTPKSTYTWPFRTIQKMRWGTLMGPSYGQYCTRIVAGILFHSVAGSHMSSYNLAAGNYNMLGMPASHGCVRLNVRDAKWIYDHCKLGMEVIINDKMYQPFDKPATIKIPAGQNWDPTDPNV